MAAQPSVKDSFTFVGGLTTEGGFFIVPENSWVDGENVVPATDGSISRRVGIDYESTYQLFATSIYDANLDHYAFTQAMWESVNGDGNHDILVVQLGPTLHFYKAASGTVSATKYSFTYTLTPCFGSREVVGRAPISAVSCYGKLLVTSADTEPFLIIYEKDDAGVETFTIKEITVKIRDFSGIRSPKEAHTEHTEAEWTAVHFWPHALYNLYNQGWTDAKINAYKTAKSNLLPANTKQWYYGKDTSDNFDVAVLDKQDFGTTLAPKGRFVLDAFYQDRAAVLGTFPDVNTTLVASIPTKPNVDDDRYVTSSF